MWELIPIFIFSCALSFISHSNSVYNEKTGEYKKIDKVVYALLVLCIVFFVGLRTRFNDTRNYLDSYNSIPKNVNIFYKVNFLKPGENPGFWLLQNIIHNLGFSGQDFLLFFSFISLVPTLWFIHKHSNNIVLSIFLTFTVGIITLNAAAIKQSCAMGLGLIAIDAYLNKKKIKFILWILIGVTIHPYVLMFAIAPVLTFKPWGEKTFVLLIVFAIAGFAMQVLVNTILEVTSMLGEEYVTSSFLREGVNPFRVLVALAPSLLSYIVSKSGGYTENTKEQNLYANFTMLNGLIMFLALFGTANYFGRLAHYFLPFVVISIPYMLSCLKDKDRVVFGFIIVFAYLFYFWYENIHGGLGTFDDYFDRINIFEYLKQLI